MTRFSLMAEHHPDFDQSTLPDIPSDWVDTTWRNDLCPSFNVPDKAVRIWIDYLDPALRDVPDWPRYTITKEDDEGLHDIALVATEDWQEIMGYLARN